jgi:SPP1 family phage portal protein
VKTSSVQEWLSSLETEQRLSSYKTYESYYQGEHTVALPAKIKAALTSELGTIDNYCRVVVETPVDYILGGEVGVEIASDPEAEAFLYDVFRESYMWDEQLIKVLTYMCKKGDAYIKLYIEEDVIKLRALTPDLVFPRYASSDCTKMLYCAIKWWEDTGVGTPEHVWKAQVFYDDRVEYYTLSEEGRNSGWYLDRVEENILGFIPVVHCKNTIDEYEFGTSDILPIIPLQDALNKTITDMLLTMDQQAFQRLFVWGVQMPKGKQISMEPGMVTSMPTPEGHVDIIPAGDITPYLGAIREIINQILTIGSLSKLPIVESEVSHPASGYALRVRTIPLERKCDRKRKVLSNRLVELSRMIFSAAVIIGIGSFSDIEKMRIKFHFKGGLPEDEQTQAQIDGIYNTMKVKSKRTIAQELGIESPDEEFKNIAEESKWEQSLIPIPTTLTRS